MKRKSNNADGLTKLGKCEYLENFSDNGRLDVNEKQWIVRNDSYDGILLFSPAKTEVFKWRNEDNNNY